MNAQFTVQGTITYPTLGHGKSSTQKCLWMGYASSLEGNFIQLPTLFDFDSTASSKVFLIEKNHPVQSALGTASLQFTYFYQAVAFLLRITILVGSC